MSLIAWLDDPSGAGVDRVGGKGASLARLGAAGYPVPPGFAVTVDAYHRFHRESGLHEAISALATLAARPTMADVKAAAGPLVEIAGRAGLPTEVAAAVRAAVGELEAKAPAGATFAVRSSGVSEDGASASFAGLYESYLNLAGEDAITAAVADCYRCLWEPRAVHYRQIKGVDHSREAMAVVVMQTVHSHVSGVAFSLNPVTGAEDEVLINASWGLGESIVSGTVTPDNYIAAKDGAIRQKDVSEKLVRVVSVPGGTEQQATPAALARKPAMSDAQIRQVAETTASIEQHYGCPMDIEFAYDAEGRFYLLQARPITTR